MMPEIITHSVLDWLNAIPEDMAREAALQAYKEQYCTEVLEIELKDVPENWRDLVKDHRAPDFSTALNQAFVWLATREGRNYWAYIHKKLKYQIKL